MDLLLASIRIATPLLLAALGGLLSERAGIFAVGLEGMMLCGAFAAFAATAATGSQAAGILASAAAGVLAGCALAAVVVRTRADNMVAGLSINIVALGVTSTFAAGAAVRSIPTLAAWPCPVLDRLPVVGPLFVQPPLTWLALAACAALSFVLGRTRPGLVLRCTGENPDAVLAAGTEPAVVRTVAVIACGALAGLGGAVLVLQQVGTFADGMTGGRGYLALAALIVGRWSPVGTAVACLAFGAAEALELHLEAAGVAANPYLLQMTPYATALLVLSVLGRSAQLPAAIGRPLKT